MGLLMILIIVGIGVWYGVRSLHFFHQLFERPLARPVPSASPDVLVPNRVSTLGSVLGCWLPPTAVMIVFAGLSGVGRDGWNPTRRLPPKQVVTSVIGSEQIHVYPPADATRNPLQKSEHSVVSLSKRPSSVDSLASLPVTDAGLELNRPKWISEGDQTNGDIRRLVLTSQLWSTDEEAVEELQTELQVLVRDDFERRHGETLPSFRLLSRDRIVKTAVKEHYLERSQQDFGSFSAPMSQLWWQVEISPVVRTDLYPEWRTAVVQNRVLHVGMMLAFCTLLASTAAQYGKLRVARGQQRVPALSVSLLSAAVWVGVVMIVAKRLLA